MKKLTNKWWFWVGIILLCLVFSYAMEARGDERISLEVAPMVVLSSSDHHQSAEQGYGIKARAKLKLGDGDFQLGLWGSYEERNLRLWGQRAGTLTLYGFGPGAYANLTKNISIYGEIGYRLPKYSMSGRMKLEDGAEGMWLAMKDFIESTDFPIPISEFESFERKVNGGFSATIGLDLHYNIGKHWKVGFDFGYRFLELEEHRIAYLPKGWRCYPGQQKIETKQAYNYGGPTMEFKVKYTFKSIFGM